MAKTIGQGEITFGTLAAEIEAATMTVQGKTVPAVRCTAATDTSEQYGAGNIADYGQVTGTMMVDPDSLVADLDTLIGTIATLTVKYQIGTSGNTTNAQWTGQAIFLQAPQTLEPNVVAKGAFQFQWTTKPTPSNEAA